MKAIGQDDLVEYALFGYEQQTVLIILNLGSHEKWVGGSVNVYSLEMLNDM